MASTSTNRRSTSTARRSSSSGSGRSSSARSRSTSAGSRSRSTSGGSRGRSTSGGSRSRSTAAKGRTSAAQRSASGSKRQEGRREQLDYALYYEIIVWCVLGLSVILFVCNLGWGGSLGRALRSFMFGCFGILAYLFPFMLFFITAFLISNFGSRLARIKVWGAILCYLTLCGFAQLSLVGYNSMYSLGEYYAAGSLYHTGGGLIGGCLASVLVPVVGVVVAYIVLFLMLLISLILMTQRSILRGIRRRSSSTLNGWKENRQQRRAWSEQRRQEREAARALDRERTRRQLTELVEEDQAAAADPADSLSPGFIPILPKHEPRIERKFRGLTDDTLITLPPVPPSPAAAEAPKRRTQRTKTQMPAAAGTGAADLIEATPVRTETQPASDPAGAPAKRPVSEPKIRVWDPQSSDESHVPAASPAGSGGASLAREDSGIREDAGTDADGAAAGADEAVKTRRARKIRSSEEEKGEGIREVDEQMKEAAGAAPITQYRFPPLDMLSLPSSSGKGFSRDELQDAVSRLEQVFETFGVNVTITDVVCGPSVTRFELTPNRGVKVSKIVSLQDDIKLNLATQDIRIEAPIPGKAAVGIEVPNKHATGVVLRELLESPDFTRHPSKIAYAVGRDITGKIIVSDIAKMPHLLIAGATGSGKSVFINTLILSILYKARPDEVKMIMIDPKVVELSVYNGIPHLLIPVVTDPKKAAGALNWAVAEMTKRFKTFEQYHVRDLAGYNARVDAVNADPSVPEEEKKERMPQIVVIIDELADLMMVASADVEDAICRLAQLARAAGIHLVVATQRPSVDVITGLIKANMPSRIAFSVSSGVDSRTILGMNGAEKLLGNGDMLFAPQNFKQPLRVQGAYVSDDEILHIANFLKEEYADMASYDEKVQEQINSGQSMGHGDGGSDTDDLFAQAARLIIDKDKASVSMLQRYFKIGFNRAARIMDQLSEAGVVGPEEGTKPRKVLMSPEQFENYLSGGG